MEKKKKSHTQENLLIVFVTVCFVLVAATLIMAFDEASVDETAQDYVGGDSPPPTLSPLLPTARPGSGGGGGSGNQRDEHDHDEHDIPTATDDHADSARQATLTARSDAEQQGLDY